MCTPDLFSLRNLTSEESLSVEERADRYVRRLKGFYAHAASYVGVNALLIVINLLTSPDVFWAIWPILGWGVKLVAHATAVFGTPGVSDWEERTRRAYIRRHTRRARPASSEPHLEREGDAEAETEIEQLHRRLRNLETIVTSADWELLSGPTLPADDADEKAAALARDVVQE